MERKLTLAVDMMSGDHGLHVALPAVVKFAACFPDTRLILVGDQKAISSHKSLPANIEVVHTESVVNMDEPPLQALKFNKKSSMRLAIDLVKSGRAHGVVSAGNTGALVAISKFVLKMMRGLKRPVLAGMSGVKTADQPGSLFLDLGATVDSTATHLHQYAILGCAAFKSMTGAQHDPSVALLNIGKEDIKGNSLIKDASTLFVEDQKINFLGYIEPTEIINCPVDVVVMDGFVGNIMVKTIECLLTYTKVKLTDLVKSKFIYILCAPVIKRIISLILKPIKKDTGAILIGLRGLVVKAHGGANVEDFVAVLETCRLAVLNNLVDELRINLDQYLASQKNKDAVIDD